MSNKARLGLLEAHLGIQDTQFLQSLHHLLIINVAGVVPVISPVHKL